MPLLLWYERFCLCTNYSIIYYYGNIKYTGLRTIKSIILRSVALRNHHTDFNESQIILHSIIDENLPKLIEEDIPIFTAIYEQIFPEINLPQVRFIRIIFDHFIRYNI